MYVYVIYKGLSDTPSWTPPLGKGGGRGTLLDKIEKTGEGNKRQKLKSATPERHILRAGFGGSSQYEGLLFWPFFT